MAVPRNLASGEVDDVLSTAIGLTNGAMGYIPTRRAYAEGGYEAGYRSARYEDDTGHRWAAAAGEMLQALAKER